MPAPTGNARTDFEKDIDRRLVEILDARSSDDIPFLVACVRHWKQKAEEADAALMAEQMGDDI